LFARQSYKTIDNQYTGQEFCICIIAFNFIYIIGHLITTIFFLKLLETNNKWYISFVKLTIGLLLSVLLFSIFKTKFYTVNILLIIPMVFLLKSTTISFSLNLKNIFNKIINIPINILLLLTVFIHYIQFHGFFKTILLPLDVSIYAEISYFLNQGFENTLGSLNSVFNINYAQAYHYFELWFNTMIANIFHITYAQSFILIAYPVLVSVVATGIMSFVRSTHNNIIIQYSATFLFLFVGPLIPFNFQEVFPFIKTAIFENSGFFHNTLVFSYYGTKHIVFYIISLLFVSLWLQHRKQTALIILSIAPIINIGLLPAIFGGCILYICFLFFKKQLTLQSLLTLLPIFIVSISIGLFYFLSSINKDVLFVSSNFIYTFSSDLNIKGELLRFIFRPFFAVLWIIIIYFPYISLIFINDIRKNTNTKEVFTLILLIIITGVLTRPFFDDFNSTQLLTFTLPLLNVFIISQLAIIKSKKYLTKSIVIVLFALIFTNAVLVITKNYNSKRFLHKTYDNEYVQKVLIEISGNNCSQYKFGYILDDKTLKSTTSGHWYPKTPAQFVCLYHNCFHMYSLNYPFYRHKKSSLMPNNSTRNHMQYFLKDTISENVFSIEQERVINELGIDFIFTKNTTLPQHIIDNLVCFSIYDAMSNETFYVIKK